MIRHLALSLGLALIALASHAQAPLKVWKEPATGIEFVPIPKGCFRMGNDEPVAEPPDTLWRHLGPGRDLAADERPRHEVCVDGFWMGRYEVRRSDWRRVMGGKGAARDAALPMSGVSFVEAEAFARRLTELTGGKHRFRLPTEAEWEYACRAGTVDEIVPLGSDLVDRAWYSINEDASSQASEVGKLAANAFGLHDMLGNVWEWVQDDYRADAYAAHALYNPLVRGDGGRKVIRGGSHRSEPVHMRCANRGAYPEGEALYTIGFRLVRTQ